jgi:uncharacterized surface protein with fasciclin (FAS1) repeats
MKRFESREDWGPCEKLCEPSGRGSRRVNLIISKRKRMRSRTGRFVKIGEKWPFFGGFWANLAEIRSFLMIFRKNAYLVFLVRFRILLLVLLSGAGLIAGLASCKKSPPPAPIQLSPLQKLVNTDTSLSLYHRLILQANETALLNDDTVTLLIPVNAAFRAAGYSADSIDNISATQANNIVQYDFIPGRVIIPLADSGAYIPYNTLLGFPIYGMSDGAHVWFNGVQAVQDTAATGKAIVYLLGALAGTPPADSLAALLGGDSTLTFLAEAMLVSGLDSTLPAGSYTLLAPINSAWEAAGYDSLGAIDSANPAVLTQLLEYQFVQGIYFTNTLSMQSSLPTLEGSPVTVTFQNGLFQFSGPGNPVPANLLSGNQFAGAGLLVYKIDQVLMP